MRKLILFLALALLLCICADGATKIGLDRLNWSQSIGGVKFSGTAPASTAGTLYNESGTLKFNGTDVLLGGYHALIRSEAGGYFAYAQNGTIIASDTSAPFDFGAVLDAVTDLGPDQTILVDGDFFATTTGSLVNGTKLCGVGDSSISTSSIMVVIGTDDTDYLHRDIVIEDLRIFYTGTATPTTALIEIHDPLSCTIRNVNAVCTSVAAYNSGYRGSLSLTSDIPYTWLNKIEACTLNQIRLDNITDSLIENNAINTYGKGSQAIKLIGLCNNIKIIQNEIVCDTTSGINIAAACWNLQITENYFEAHMHSPTPGNGETAIKIDASTRYCMIANNHFAYLNGNGILFNGKYGIISDNVFENMNNADNSYSDIDLTGDTNLVTGNLGTNSVGSANKAVMIDDSDYNMVYNNHAKGDGYSNIFVSGGHSLADNNVCWPGAL